VGFLHLLNLSDECLPLDWIGRHAYEMCEEVVNFPCCMTWHGILLHHLVTCLELSGGIFSLEIMLLFVMS